MKWIKTIFLLIPILFIGGGLWTLIQSIINGTFDSSFYWGFGLIIAIAGYVIFAVMGDPLRGGLVGLIINILTWPITGFWMLFMCIRKIREIHNDY